MSSKTRIIVLHMKEIIYTAVFLALAVILAVVLFFMFGPGKNASHTASEKSRYKPGVYTSSITLNENTFDVEVTVNADRINIIDKSNDIGFLIFIMCYLLSIKNFNNRIMYRCSIIYYS